MNKKAVWLFSIQIEAWKKFRQVCFNKTGAYEYQREKCKNFRVYQEN